MVSIIYLQRQRDMGPKVWVGASKTLRMGHQLAGVISHPKKVSQKVLVLSSRRIDFSPGSRNPSSAPSKFVLDKSALSVSL
jgi:hypothetical protein